MTAHISSRRLTQIRLQIPRWRTKLRPCNTIISYISAIYYYKHFVFFTELCVMTAHISCRSLTQIGLQIPKWRTKWRPCNGMDVSQAFIFHFKCYSILHFAVCQLLAWTFLSVLCLHRCSCSFAGKIEMVKSKWGLAFSAVITVFASLIMSASLCITFGLTPSLSGGQVEIL